MLTLLVSNFGCGQVTTWPRRHALMHACENRDGTDGPEVGEFARRVVLAGQDGSSIQEVLRPTEKKYNAII